MWLPGTCCCQSPSVLVVKQCKHMPTPRPWQQAEAHRAPISMPLNHMLVFQKCIEHLSVPRLLKSEQQHCRQCCDCTAKAYSLWIEHKIPKQCFLQRLPWQLNYQWNNSIHRGCQLVSPDSWEDVGWIDETEVCGWRWNHGGHCTPEAHRETETGRVTIWIEIHLSSFYVDHPPHSSLMVPDTRQMMQKEAQSSTPK